MKNISIILTLLMVIFVLYSCSEKDEEQESAFCDRVVTIDNEAFQNRPNNDGTAQNAFEIINAEIEGDCLLISIQSGGCNGNTWKVDLVDADRIAETTIPQRDLKVFFDNNELCNAITVVTVSFEITSLRTNGNEVTLNLEKWASQLKYSY